MLTALLRVTVNVNCTDPLSPSATLGELIVSLEDSLSTIVNVAPVTVREFVAVPDIATDLLPSWVLLSTAVILTAPVLDVDPAAIVSVLFILTV